jgi:2-aminoethylphosphonate-pyruvate transaminase
MQLTGCSDPRRVAKIGDTPADLGEGTAAECGFVVGVTSGSHTRDELLPHPHTHLVETLDELWPILGLRTLLFTPGPLTTAPRVKAAMLRDVGSRDADFVAVVADVRDRLLSLAGVSRQAGYETVLLPGSGTYGVEAMLRTLAPTDGTLLIADNGAYGARMIEMAQIADIRHVALRSSPANSVAPDAVGLAIDRDPSIAGVALVHCETTTGVLNPLREIAAAVHGRGRRLLVDGMSSFAGIPLGLDEDGIDALAASSNKCLEAVPGCAFVIARRALLASSDGRAGSLALDLAAQFRAFERDGQFRFTPPTQVVLSMARALDELDREGGVEARAARYRANHFCLIAGMRALGFAEIVPPAHQSDIITAFRYPDDPAFTFDDFYERLRRRGLIIYPGKLAEIGCFRIGTIGQIGLEDIERLVAGIRSVLAEMDPFSAR